MIVSPSVVLLSIGVGAPVLLLALGVLYHGYVLANQPAAPDRLTEHVASAAVEPAEELVAELQDAMHEIRGQLGSQRQALSNLLSAATQSPQTARAPVLAPASGAPLPAGPSADMMDDVTPGAATEDLTGLVRRLVAEGLSDRAIARRMRIGLEEVRIARTRIGSQA